MLKLVFQGLLDALGISVYAYTPFINPIIYVHRQGACMSQSAALVKALKQCLKQNNLKYADVAEALSLSEASVKRLFSEENFSRSVSIRCVIC